MKRQILHTRARALAFMFNVSMSRLQQRIANMRPLMAIQRYCSQIRYLLFQACKTLLSSHEGEVDIFIANILKCVTLSHF